MHNNLIQAIRQLAASNRVFCSEADFQFALAWELQRIPGAQIFLESGVPVGQDTFYVDIIVDLNGKRYYIELKYQTSLCKTSFSGFPINLKNQSAQDIMRYDYLKDINRLLTIKKWQERDFGGGYAVILTNDRLMYNVPRSSTKTPLDFKFRIHDRRGLPEEKNIYPVPGDVNWNNANKSQDHWTKTGPRKDFSLPMKINTNWEQYLKITDNNGKEQDFKYLINVV